MSLRGKLREARARAARKRGDIVEAEIGETLITGCRATQTSADAYIGRTYNGALTYSLVAALQAARGKLTSRELHTATLAATQDWKFRSGPATGGRRPALDRPFLASLD